MLVASATPSVAVGESFSFKVFGRVDRLDRRSQRLTILPAGIVQAVPDQVHDAGLQRGGWVFPYKGKALTHMNGSAWKRARVEAAENWEQDKGEPAHRGFAHLRVHDLKHTFGRRLRVAGVCFEDRQALLGHKSESVTTDYSAAEIETLIAQANKVVAGDQRSSPTLTVLRRRAA